MFSPQPLRHCDINIVKMATSSSCKLRYFTTVRYTNVFQHAKISRWSR